jgi:hypothetical protein
MIATTIPSKSQWKKDTKLLQVHHLRVWVYQERYSYDGGLAQPLSQVQAEEIRENKVRIMAGPQDSLAPPYFDARKPVYSPSSTGTIRRLVLAFPLSIVGIACQGLVESILGKR